MTDPQNNAPLFPPPQHPDELNVDLCVIGAGSAGLSIASGAAQLGLDVVLIEKSAMGGDCLNTGCVPSKSMIEAAKAIHNARTLDAYNQKNPDLTIDFAGIHKHVHDVIRQIEPHDSQERFEGLGVKVIREAARFTDSKTVRAGRHTIRARKFVISTGSHASIPPIKRLDPALALTNENIFNLTKRPAHLVIIGGGPIGVEMAQAHKRLGSKVTLITNGRILEKDDADCAALLKETLVNEGIKIHEHSSIDKINHKEGDVTAHISSGEDIYQIDGTHLLVATGRRANIENLGLEAAGITTTETGIVTDRRLRTSQKHIFAAGDVATEIGGGPQFTHIAGYHAGIIIRNLIFKLPAKTDYKSLPWVTYTDPELAQIGLTESAALEKFGAHKIEVIKIKLKEIDRAVAARTTGGLAKLICTSKGRVLGVTILAPHAGDLLGVWSLVIDQNLKLSAVASMIAPYPSYGEINKRLASAYFTSSLFSPKTRFFAALLQKLPF